MNLKTSLYQATIISLLLFSFPKSYSCGDKLQKNVLSEMSCQKNIRLGQEALGTLNLSPVGPPDLPCPHELALLDIPEEPEVLIPEIVDLTKRNQALRIDGTYSGAYEYVLKSIGDKLKNGCTKENSLFIFDIDETVLHYVTILVQGDKRFVRNMRLKLGRRDLNSKHFLTKIKNLGISMLALTARPAYNSKQLQSGKLPKNFLEGAIKDVKDENLLKLINFNVFKNSQGFTNHKNKKSEQGYFSIAGYENTPMAYKEGIIGTGGQDKGLALTKFLELTGKLDHFKCVFFIDDENRDFMPNHDNMKAAIEKLGKGIKLFRYKFPKVKDRIVLRHLSDLYSGPDQDKIFIP